MQPEKRLEQLFFPLDNRVEFNGDVLIIENKHSSRLHMLLGIGCLLAVLYLLFDIFRQFQEEGEMDWFEVGLAGLFLAGAFYFFRTQNQKVILDRRAAVIQQGKNGTGTSFTDINQFVMEDQRYFANYLFTSFQVMTQGGKRISLFRYNRRKQGEGYHQEVAEALRAWMRAG